MSRTSSAILPVTDAALRLLLGLNWLFGAGILALLVASLAFEPWTMTALGVPVSPETRTLILGMRAVAFLGLLATTLHYVLLKRLLVIVETVRRGDPFVAANALRLKAISWVLLALQLLSLVIGGIGKAVSTAAYPLRLDAGFSTSGWLAVLFAFVLTQVFAEGTRMRDDLDGTV